MESKIDGDTALRHDKVSFLLKILLYGGQRIQNIFNYLDHLGTLLFCVLTVLKTKMIQGIGRCKGKKE